MKIIHVNRQFIAKNAKDGKNRPVYTMKQDGRGVARYAREVVINGPSRLVYGGSQLSCGARAWIEVEDHIEVIMIDEMSFKDAKDIENESV